MSPPFISWRSRASCCVATEGSDEARNMRGPALPSGLPVSTSLSGLEAYDRRDSFVVDMGNRKSSDRGSDLCLWR